MAAVGDNACGPLSRLGTQYKRSETKRKEFTVAANSFIRTNMYARAAPPRLRVNVPELRHCTDNGAMIAAAGWKAYTRQEFASLAIEPFAQHLRPKTMPVTEAPTFALTT